MSLPPLPGPVGHLHSNGDFCQERVLEIHATGRPIDLFSADQMRTYAAAAVEAEREAIIAMMPGGDSVDPQWVCDAIRARSKA